MFPRTALLLLALALPASASAGTLGEVAPLNLHGDEDCATATGAPGELVFETKTGVRFVTATRDGLRLGPALEFGESFECEAVKVRPNGAGVVVGDVNGALVAMVRDPGGNWSAPITLSKAETRAYAVSVAADVSERGDVIVAYKESRFDEEAHERFKVARRAPGGPFGPEQRIGPASEQLGDVAAGIAATGEAFVVTSSITSQRAPFKVPVEVRFAAPGAAFGAPVHLADTHLLTAPSLAVGADGRALVAIAAGPSMVVAERAPGEGFGAPAPIGAIGDGALNGAEVKLGPDGAAAVVWQRMLPFDLQLVSRSAPGAFSSPVVAYDATGLLPADFDPFYFSETYLAELFGGGTFSSGDTSSLAMTPDGRVVFGIADGTRATLVGAPLTGGPLVRATSGTLFGTSGEGAVLVLADGTPAVAWTESVTGQFGGVLGDSERYRLHLAAEGVSERPDPPAPRVTVGAPLSRTIGQRGLRLPITCSAACQVVADLDSSLTTLGGSVRMTRAGRRTLTIGGIGLIAPEHLGPVRIDLRYAALDALHPRERTVTVRVRRAAEIEVPRVSAVRATRVGDRIRVTFRVDHGSDELFVSGDDTRVWNGEALVTRTVTAKPDKRDYTVTLPAKGVKFVTVRVPALFFGVSKTVVRVREVR